MTESKSRFAPSNATRAAQSPLVPFLMVAGACVIAGAVVGALLALKNHGAGSHAWPPHGSQFQLHKFLARLLWLLLAWFLSIAAHEAGHLLFGASVGMRPILYIVGPLRIAREGDRFRIGFNSNLASWGGLAVCMPSTTERLRERMAWMVAGGPLTSLALALLCGAVVAAFGPAETRLFMAIGILSFVISLATLLPMSAGGFRSDGGQLLDYRRGGTEIERRGLLILLSGASMAGRRPRDLDPALLDRALQLSGSRSNRAAVVLLAATVSVDRGRPDEELFAELAGLHAAFPEGFRQDIANWMAWYTAAHRRDPELARRWLALGRGGVADSALRDLAEAALAQLSGDATAARAAAARGLARRPGIDAGEGILVRDLLASFS